MRHGRHLVAAALAGPLALSLIAAAAPSTGPSGTASTTLSAVDLAITTPVGDGALRLVDAETYASTVTDAASSTVPLATAALTPLTGPAGPVGRIEARSDGDRDARAAATSLAGLGGPVAALAGEVGPATVSATAAADEAHAVIGAVTARIAGLADALGVTVNASDIASRVTATGATATQGLQVSDLSVALGDILPQDVLATLPLGDLLALLEALPIELPGDARGLIDAVRTALADVGTQLTAVADTRASLATSTAELAELLAVLEGLAELAALEEELALLDDDSTDLGSIGNDVDTIGGTVGGVVDGLTGTIGVVGTGGLTALATTGDCSASTTVAELEACIAALSTELLGAVGVSTSAELEALIAELVGEIEDLVDALVARIDGLTTSLTTLTSAAADLEDLLAGLDDVLADAAGLPLVGVSSVDVGVNSRSDGTVEGSSASVLCGAVTVTVLDETLTTPDCDQGLAAVRGTAALVDGLLGGLTETLNVLPLADVLTTGEVKVDLFTDLQESVVEEDGAVVATAGVTILDLAVPSITIDPGPVTDLLDQLGLPDVVAVVEGALQDTLTELEALALPALGTATATLTGALTELGAPDGVATLVAQLEALLAGLDLAGIGTLDRVSTPSISLVVDPVSTAAFTTTAAAVPAAPAGDPAPRPDAPGDQPSLPSTGGGLAVLGLASLAGAVSLRRRG